MKTKIKTWKAVLKKLGYQVKNLRDYYSKPVKRYFVNDFIVLKDGVFQFSFEVDEHSRVNRIYSCYPVPHHKPGAAQGGDK